METYTLGQKIHPNNLSLPERMGEDNYALRLHKEKEILTKGIAPAKKGVLKHVLDKLIVKSLLPTLFIISNGKLNKKLRTAYTDFRINTKELSIKTLDPKLKGIKIAHISDLHLDLKESFPSAVQRFLIKSQKEINDCDLIVITGDFQDKYLNSTDKTIEGFKKMVPEMKPPIIGVLGNHDKLKLAHQLEAIPSHGGIRILLNESLQFQTKTGGKITLQGIDDPHYYKTHNIKGPSQEALNILLSHSPEIYKDAFYKGINICLSGHTHAGQLRLPLLGAIVKAATVPKKLLQGVWHHKTLLGHTSPGLGCSGLSIRLLCPPEITILNLK